MAHYEIKKSDKDTSQPFWFVLKASNGQVIAQSEMYSTKESAKNGIESVQKNGSTTSIKDLT
ncbi:YegP family protein [Moritella viscosa]|uniref:YegP family protein n=1 Tax=Moritella viscosa TaxID=80854 RepID=UPI0009158E7C|nr:YegP family protein [Moritella viscosa]SGZ09891.1 Putative uncharacterized protein [Moritella viscosa]SHO17354.1 Putative uncharacterized protein [Moritella viscosa]